MFGQSYILTKGAPGTSTRTVIAYIADTGLRSFRMGAAAAMSYILALALLILSLVVFRLFRDKEAKA
jgi:multiple sugar transport system permease protein